MASSGSFNTSAYGSGNYYRYLNFSWSVQSQSVANNTTTIYYELKGAGGNTTSYQMSGNFKLVIDGSTVYETGQNDRIQLRNGTVLKTGTFTLSHDSAGNRSFSAQAWGAINAYARNVSGSGSWSLPTIARGATITSAPDFNDTQNPTIQYTNPAGNNVTTLQACIADANGMNIYAAYRDISKTGSSYTFNLSDAERNALRAASANSNTLTVRFYVKTIIGGTTLLNSVPKTLSIVNANPTFSASYQDTNSAIVAVTGNNQLIVQGKSSLRVSISNAVALKSATFASATCLLNGTTYNGTISNGACNFNIGTLDISSNATATVTVTDSRGNSTSQNLTIQMIAYYAPSAIITYNRANNYYTPTTVNVDANYASVNGANSVTIKVRYKKTTDSTWSSYVTFQDNVSQVLQLDNEYAWDLQTVITDLYSTVTYNMVVSRGMPIVYFDRLKSSTGFNCFPVDDESVEINGIPALRSVMTRFLTADLSNLTANSYVKINLSGSNSFGNRLTATSDGGIKIGAGVTKILVSGRMLTSCSVVGAQYIRICKNDASSSSNMLCWVSHTNTTTSAAFETINATPALVDVQENDVIYLYYYVPASSGTIYGNQNGNQTSLTVETVC